MFVHHCFPHSICTHIPRVIKKYFAASAVLRSNQKYFGVYSFGTLHKRHTAALLLLELCTLLAAGSMISYAVLTPTPHF